MSDQGKKNADGGGKGGKGGGKGGKGGAKGGAKGGGKGGKGVKRPAEPMTRQDQKRIKKEMKAKKPNYDLVEKGNEVWTILNKKLSKPEKMERMNQVFNDLKGKLVLVMSKHDTARVMQQMMKHGSDETRLEIVKELEGSIRKMMQDKHGHHFAISVLRYGNDKCKEIVYKEMKGFVSKLATHSKAAPVVDFYYASATKRQQLILLNEFFGREFVMTRFDDEEILDLKQICAKHPDRKKHILGDVINILNKAVSKQLLMFRPFHGLCSQFFHAADQKDQLELVDLLSKHPLPLHHTQEGAWILCQCLAYGNAKQRKQMLKGIKGKVAEFAMNEHAYMIIIRAMDVVDDTVLVSSSILSELKEAMDEIIQDPNGVKVLLSLVAPRNHSYFRPEDLELLQEVFWEKTSEAGEITQEPTSKKSHHARRADLLAKILPDLLSTVTANVAEMMIDKSNYSLLLETIQEGYRVSHFAYPHTDEEKTYVPPTTVTTLQKNRDSVMTALTTIATTVSNDLSIISSWSGHLLLKRLLMHAVPSGQEFSSMLCEHIKQHVGQVVQDNRGAFLLNAVLESSSEEVKKDLLQQLQKEAKNIAALDKPGHLALGKHLGLKPVTKTPAKKAVTEKSAKTPVVMAKTPASKSEKKKRKNSTDEAEETEVKAPKTPVAANSVKTPVAVKSEKKRKNSNDEGESEVVGKGPSPKLTRARKAAKDAAK